MRVVKTDKHGDVQIYVLQHWRMFMYFFYCDGNLYMQFATHWPKITSLLKGKLYADDEMNAIIDAFVGHARRSIDMLKDPSAKHCPHDVRIYGKDSAECVVCANLKKQNIHKVTPATDAS